MKEEDDILRMVGTDNAFKVPVGYFDNFVTGLMSKLPEKSDIPVKRITTWGKVKPWVYLAAMFIGAALIIRIVSFTSDSHNKPAKDIAEQYINSTVENSRMTDYQLYQYLSTPNEGEN